MNDKNRVPNSKPRGGPDASAPRKRFRIEKLEERIAPKKGGKGTHNCGGSGGATSSGSFGGGSIY
jgi:hypothetical protein